MLVLGRVCALCNSSRRAALNSSLRLCAIYPSVTQILFHRWASASCILLPHSSPPPQTPSYAAYFFITRVTPFRRPRTAEPTACGCITLARIKKGNARWRHVAFRLYASLGIRTPKAIMTARLIALLPASLHAVSQRLRAGILSRLEGLCYALLLCTETSFHWCLNFHTWVCSQSEGERAPERIPGKVHTKHVITGLKTFSDESITFLHRSRFMTVRRNQRR